jgi:hypothetical protein
VNDFWLLGDAPRTASFGARDGGSSLITGQEHPIRSICARCRLDLPLSGL